MFNVLALQKYSPRFSIHIKHNIYWRGGYPIERLASWNSR